MRKKRECERNDPHSQAPGPAVLLQPPDRVAEERSHHGGEEQRVRDPAMQRQLVEVVSRQGDERVDIRQCPGSRPYHKDARSESATRGGVRHHRTEGNMGDGIHLRDTSADVRRPRSAVANRGCAVRSSRWRDVDLSCNGPAGLEHMNTNLILDPVAVRKTPGIDGRPSHRALPKPPMSGRLHRRRPKHSRWR